MLACQDRVPHLAPAGIMPLDTPRGFVSLLPLGNGIPWGLQLEKTDMLLYVVFLINPNHLIPSIWLCLPAFRLF